MGTKNILLAIADPQAVSEVTQALGVEWATTTVTDEAEALAVLEERGPFEALLVDFNLGSPDASELLNAALEKCPDITRFLLAYEADLALIAAKVAGPHEILPKPIEPAALKRRIENGVKDSSASGAEKAPATGAVTAPAIPSVYAAVLQALEAPEVTPQQVGEIIARNTALTQEVLKLTRSAYLGFPGNLIDPVAAVEILGLQTVRALVLALRFLAEHSQLKPGYLSLESLWQHSTKVAQLARDLVLFETKDRVLASQALAGGLLHDLGKVVLAANFEDLYGRVHALARKQPVALWDIEKEMFGASHGEIGACLLGMWNMPSALVEAAAFHHEPPLGEHDHLTPLAAVHIANVLEQQLQPSEEFRVMPVMNTPFLNQLGLLQRLPVWQATFAKQPRSHAGSVVIIPPGRVAAGLAGGEASRTANHLPGPAATTRTTTSAPADQKTGETVGIFRSWPRRRVYTGVAAGVLFSLALLLRVGLDSDEPMHVKARTLDSQEAVVIGSSTPTREFARAFAPDVTPGMRLSEEALAESASAIFEPGIDSEVMATNVLLTIHAPKDSGPAPFRVNGVFYNVSKPAAIVNGATVYVGAQVNGATVISIGRDAVTLEINGERKILSVPGADGGY